MVPAEHLYDSCTCQSGMRDGLRCADCGGRGIVLKDTKITGKSVAPAEGDSVATPEDDELENMSINHLRSRAKDLGVSAGGSKDALVERIKAATKDEPTDEQS